MKICDCAACQTVGMIVIAPKAGCGAEAEPTAVTVDTTLAARFVILTADSAGAALMAAF